jgi:hypothetical protein
MLSKWPVSSVKLCAGSPGFCFSEKAPFVTFKKYFLPIYKQLNDFQKMGIGRNKSPLTIACLIKKNVKGQ